MHIHESGRICVGSGGGCPQSRSGEGSNVRIQCFNIGPACLHLEIVPKGAGFTIMATRQGSLSRARGEYSLVRAC